MINFEDYLKTLSDNEQMQRIHKIIDWVNQNFPNLKLEIKWNQPMFILDKTFIIGFSVAKNHISFSPEEEHSPFPRED